MGCRILTYHKIKNGENFEQQIRYLKTTGYRMLSLAEFIEKYREGQLHTKDILITFDDGDFSIYDVARPILVKFGVPAVVFVITELIGSDQPFWWDEILARTSDPSQVKKVKTLQNQKRLEFIDSLRKTEVGKSHSYRQLTFKELRQLESDQIAIANHSHTHPMFDQIGTPEIEEELKMSSELLKSNGFSGHDVFAYPNGNHSAQTEAVLTSLKFRLAFLFDHQIQRNNAQPYRISRLSVNDNTPLWKFKLILSGLHSTILPVIKKLRNIKS